MNRCREGRVLLYKSSLTQRCSPMVLESIDNVVPLQTDDAAIVRGVLSGDARAQRELIRRYGRLMASVILNILGPRNDLDDILQDALLIVFRDLHKLREAGALKKWLVMIAVSRARNQLRSERHKWWLTFRAPEDLPERATIPEQDDAMRAVYEALEKMKPDRRTVFALRYVSQMTIPEIAQALDVSESTAKRRIKDARARFDRCVEGDERLAQWLEGGDA